MLCSVPILKYTSVQTPHFPRKKRKGKEKKETGIMNNKEIKKETTT
jgi:hypothetical protein